MEKQLEQAEQVAIRDRFTLYLRITELYESDNEVHHIKCENMSPKERNIAHDYVINYNLYRSNLNIQGTRCPYLKQVYEGILLYRLDIFPQFIDSYDDDLPHSITNLVTLLLIFETRFLHDVSKIQDKEFMAEEEALYWKNLDNTKYGSLGVQLEEYTLTDWLVCYFHYTVYFYYAFYCNMYSMFPLTFAPVIKHFC